MTAAALLHAIQSQSLVAWRGVTGRLGDFLEGRAHRRRYSRGDSPLNEWRVSENDRGFLHGLELGDRGADRHDRASDVDDDDHPPGACCASQGLDHLLPIRPETTVPSAADSDDASHGTRYLRNKFSRARSDLVAMRDEDNRYWARIGAGSVHGCSVMPNGVRHDGKVFR